MLGHFQAPQNWQWRGSRGYHSTSWFGTLALRGWPCHGAQGREAWLVRLKGYETRESAADLAQQRLMMRAADRPPLADDDGFYVQELLGLQVCSFDSLPSMLTHLLSCGCQWSGKGCWRQSQKVAVKHEL